MAGGDVSQRVAAGGRESLRAAESVQVAADRAVKATEKTMLDIQSARMSIPQPPGLVTPFFSATAPMSRAEQNRAEQNRAEQSRLFWKEEQSKAEKNSDLQAV